MPWSLKNFLIKRIAVVDSGDNPAAEVLLFKSKEETNKEGGVVMKTFDELLKTMSEEDSKVIKDELQKAKMVKPDGVDQEDWDEADMAGKQKMMDDAKNTKVKPKSEPMVMNKSEDDLIKSADPKLQELIKKTQDELAKVITEKAEKENELKKEQLTKEAEKYTNILATKDDLVKIFTKLDGDIETTDLFKAILSANDNALKDSALVKAVGTSGDPIDRTPLQELEGKAEELAKAENISKEKAMTKLMVKEPELYKNYLEK
jgi:hypothetical protein